MNARNVLEIVRKLDGSLAAGERGLARNVHFIEVMEVPDVEEWATEGILVVTNFYSVKDDPARQADIVSALIGKKAAGLIIKLGRFIEKLPIELIELANQHDFPMMTIPKDVAYIDLLTPLYDQLHKDGDTTADHNALHSFQDMVFHSVGEALKYLSSILNGSAVYIEDAQGLLLYASGRLFRDPWRKSNVLFSVPAYRDYKENLERWKNMIEHETHPYIYLPGKLGRLIIPLYARQEIFAFIHLPFHNRKLLNEMSERPIASIQHKIYEIMMSELIEMQKQCMSQADEFRRVIAEKSNRKAKVVLYIQSGGSFRPGSSRFVDYDCMLQKKWQDLLEQLPNVETALIFKKEEEKYALIVFSEWLPIERLVDEMSIIVDRFPVQGARIGISPVFYHFDELDERTGAVTKMMDFGREFYPGQKVYSYHQIGIYEFLIKWSQEPSVREYARQILGPLEEEGDPDLLDTLAVYLGENGNASKAAEKLYIHRRTMTNRLLRIKKLLNMDLDNAEHIFILQFCLKIRKLNRQ